jgi:hypothetical protein
VNLST